MRGVGCSGEFNKLRGFRGFSSWWPPIQWVEELKATHPALKTSSKKPEMKKNPKRQSRGKQRKELKEEKKKLPEPTVLIIYTQQSNSDSNCWHS